MEADKDNVLPLGFDEQIQEAQRLADLYYIAWLNGNNDYLIPLWHKWQARVEQLQAQKQEQGARHEQTQDIPLVCS